MVQTAGQRVARGIPRGSCGQIWWKCCGVKEGLGPEGQLLVPTGSHCSFAPSDESAGPCTSSLSAGLYLSRSSYEFSISGSIKTHSLPQNAIEVVYVAQPTLVIRIVNISESTFYYILGSSKNKNFCKFLNIISNKGGDVFRKC